MTKQRLARAIYATTGGWLFIMAIGCGGGGAGGHEGTYCNDSDASQCVTLTALSDGTDGSEFQGAMNTIRLSIDGQSSSASECSWNVDRPGCDFVFGPSTITRPPNAPMTTIGFYDGYITIMGAAQPAGADNGTHWVK